MFHLQIFGMLSLGLPAVFMGPALLATIIDACLSRAGVGGEQTWRICFIACSVVIVPLLFWIEIGTDGRFFEMEAASLGSADDFPFMQLSSYGEYEIRRQEGAIIGFTEVMLFAPRITIAAMRQWRVRRVIGSV